MEDTAVSRVEHALADRRREHLFFIGMASVMALVVLVGFARSFFFAFLWREPAPDASADLIYYVHGAFAAAWMAIAVVQPVLIRARRVQWHRRFGRIAVLIAAVVLATGIFAAILSAARSPESSLPPTPLDFLGVIVSGIILYGVFVGLAVVNRSNGATHKRLMYLATINLLQAAIVRIPLPFLFFAGPWITFLAAYMFILPLVIWDLRTLGGIHKATLWGGAGIILSLPIRLWLSETTAWLTIAEWSVRLVSN